MSNEAPAITPARFEDAPALRLVGLKQSYKFSEIPEIGKLWTRLDPYCRPGQVTYGVSESNGQEDGFDYTAAVDAADPQAPSGGEFATLELPAQRYAVFTHAGDVTTFPQTIHGIMSGWLPASPYEMTSKPMMYERYGEGFDPETMKGDLEIWVPIKEKNV